MHGLRSHFLFLCKVPEELKSKKCLFLIVVGFRRICSHLDTFPGLCTVAYTDKVKKGKSIPRISGNENRKTTCFAPFLNILLEIFTP